ncbi:MAG: tetratricopeptide repeat protein [Elusimicrobia bacterium]|nr:tetratricopeptide repeat protein [Elusimicrobiota bacterium]
MISKVKNQGQRRKNSWALFGAESAYADSMFRLALGDSQGSVDAIRGSLRCLPTYAPAILSMGSVEYQMKRSARGRDLFLSLLNLSDSAEDLHEIIEKAGDFLIQIKQFDHALELYRMAAKRFPRVVEFHDGVGHCADKQGFFKEAIAASRKALRLKPKNYHFVNNLGWCLYRAGRLREAQALLKGAVAMDKSNKIAQENLRMCETALRKNAKVNGELRKG